MKVRLADRLKEVEEYYFSTKLKEIARLVQSGEHIINLGIGKPDLAPPAKVINALNEEAMNPQAHGYQSYKGIPELRQAISQYYEKYFRVTLDSETEILPLMGSKEGIMHLSMALLNPGDEVLIPNPGYPTYACATKLTGAKTITYTLSESNNYQLNIEELDSLTSERTKLIWINYPHMPTGAIASQDKLEELILWAKAREIVIASDSPYAFIMNENPISILALPHAKEVCVELNSLSKSHGMSGWRVGMAVGNHELINAMLRFKSNMDSGMFRPIQIASIEAMELGEQWFNANDEIYKRRRDLVWNMLEKIGFGFNPKTAGLFVWSKVSERFKNGDEASDFILERCKVFVPPGRIFGDQGEQYVRWSLCEKEETIDEACRRIISVMNY